MQVSVEQIGNLERKMTISVPAQQYDTRVQERFRELSQTLRIKGFRPGKVPSQVIEQRFGSQIRNEALSDVIGRSFEQAVSENKFRVAMAPRIKTNKIEKGGEIEFEATFELMPELSEIDVSNLQISKITSTVGDEDVERMIETLRQQRKAWKPVDRPAKVADMVLFELSAEADEIRFPAEGAERLGTVVGSGGMFDALEAALVGMAAGENKAVSLAYPEQFREPKLAGKTALTALTCVRVQEGEIPNLDAAFVETFGVIGGNIEQFRSDVKANLNRELQNAISSRIKLDATEKLIHGFSTLELPVGMIDAEAKALLRQVKENATRMGSDASQLSLDAVKPQARNRVLAALLLGEIARQNKIPLDHMRVKEALTSIASTYEEPEQVIALYNRDQQLMNGLRNRVLEDQVIDWVVSKANVSEQKMSFAEVMQAARS